MPIRHKFERSTPRQPGAGGTGPAPRPGYPPREPDGDRRGRRELPAYVDLAEAYVPPQPYSSQTYDLAAALGKGTIFPALYRPYRGHFWQVR